MKKYYLLPFLLGFSFCGYSQVGIGTVSPNESSQLEVVATNKGILLPRVSLTSTTDKTTITNGNVESLLVFNTNTTADITPGYYYWHADKWHRMSSTNSETITKLTDNLDGTITYINESGVSVTIRLIKVETLQGAGPGTNGAPGIPGSSTPGAPGAGVTIVTNDSGTWVFNPTTNMWTNINGTKGDKGDPGVVGVQGQAGTSGTPGIPGSSTPGAPGAGVTIVTNDSGTWVFNPTTNMWTNINGTKGDKGDPGVVGVQGQAGTSGTPGIPGSSTPGAPGAGVTIVTNDSGTWVFNPTTNMWTNINGTKGDKGDPGVVGVQGQAGTSGTPGIPGSSTPGAPIAGVTIVTNDSGTWVFNPTTNMWTNINGTKGDKGDPGVVGVQGQAGTSGTPGIPGSSTPGAPGAGVTIVTNDSGTWVFNPTTNMWTNINGTKGDKGDPGVVGVQGQAGTSGTPGIPGSSTPGAPGAGVTIVTNDSGTWVFNPTTNMWTNINGTKGDKGDPGVVGVQGQAGTSGTPGIPGSSTPGAPGAGVTIVTNDSGTWVFNPTTNMWTNINGTKGDKGDPGVVGVQGQAGTSGTPGGSSTPGAQGARSNDSSTRFWHLGF